MSYVRTGEEEKLVEELRAIRDNEYKVPEGVEPYAMVQRILEVLGAPDEELRDLLGYSVMGQWIYRQGLLTSEQLCEMLRRVIADDMLRSGLGEQNTSSVFLRTFSALTIALVLLRDNEEEFLSREEFANVVTRLVAYCEGERDLRGYVEEGGWAHAAAHVADAVDECMKHRFADEATCVRLWHGLAALVNRAAHVFDAEEDERIAVAVRAMVAAGKVAPETLVGWLQEAAREIEGDAYRERMICRTNWKHLVRSLYFGLRVEGMLGDTEVEVRWLELERGLSVR